MNTTPIMMSMSERAVTVRRVNCFRFKRSLIVRSSVIDRIRSVDSNLQQRFFALRDGYLGREARNRKPDGLLRASTDEMHVRINLPQNVVLLRIGRARCQQCLLTSLLTALM
jgi:hypothetical protein